MIKDLKWFKKKIEPYNNKYSINYYSFSGVNSDFGSIERVEFTNGYYSGGVDFWSSGYVTIHLIISNDEILFKELIDLHLPPKMEDDINKGLDKLFYYLAGKNAENDNK